MELTKNLESQMLQNLIAEVGINPNYWCPVAWSNGLKLSELISVRFWQQNIVIFQKKFQELFQKLFQEQIGKFHVLKNACHHQDIEADKCEVLGSNLLLPHPAWEFNREEFIRHTIVVKNNYLHDRIYLEGISSPYLMRLPVGLGPQETYSLSLLFLRTHPSQWLLRPIEREFASFIWHFSFKFLFKFLFAKKLDQDNFEQDNFDQDVEILENEQRAYLKNPNRCYVEINPAIIALQRAIVNQYEKFMQQSKQLSGNTNGNYQKSSPLKQALA